MSRKGRGFESHPCHQVNFTFFPSSSGWVTFYYWDIPKEPAATLVLYVMSVAIAVYSVDCCCVCFGGFGDVGKRQNGRLQIKEWKPAKGVHLLVP